MPSTLLDHRSDPSARAVLADLRLERGEGAGRLGVELWIAEAAANDVIAGATDVADAVRHAAAAAATDVADANAATDATDADTITTAVADAADTATTAAVADAEDAAAAVDTDREFLNAVLTQNEETMTEGITIVQTFTRYGYAITRVGWLRRDHGDEWSLHEARTMLRKDGVKWEPDGLDQAAAKGPGDRYTLTEPAATPIEYHRLTLPPTRPCFEGAWATWFQKPKS